MLCVNFTTVFKRSKTIDKLDFVKIKFLFIKRQHYESEKAHHRLGKISAVHCNQ